MSYLQWIRQQVGSQKILLVFATACVRDENGRVLWQRRRDFGWWGLPGGILERDESLPHCVIREVKEETGLAVVPIHLIGVYTSPTFDVTYPNGDEVQQVTVCFECRVTGGTLQADQVETADLAWFEAAASPPTSPWYETMIGDLALGQEAATFRRGTPGMARTTEPYFKRLRRHIGQAEYIMPGAAAFIQNEAGHILLQQRGDDGRWGMPGGALEPGERIDQTIINEVYEETNLHIEPTRVIGVYSDERFRIQYPNGDAIKLVSILFACRIMGGQLQPDGVESLDVRFFPAHALPPLPLHHACRIQDALRQQEKAIFQ